MAATRLDQLVTVRGRFHRSVSLVRDWQGSRDLSEYVVTPAVQAIAEQILDELGRPASARAWSLTGPYGTGKSAFALFLADLLASKKPAHEIGRQLRKTYLPRTAGMVPVLLQAERASLLPAIVNALATAMRPFSTPVANKARRLLKQESISGEAVAELILEAAEKATVGGAGGLVLVVDEFGKYLEHAAANKSHEDVFALQQLAEAATRSKAPVLFVTILHSGFADYVDQGDGVRRAEWQKVQGRFRDIPFQLPSEQLLTLVSHALETKLKNGIGSAYQREFKRIVSSKDVRQALPKGQGMRDLLSECLPFHPIVSLVLWPLFRSKVAQNERSLFAFLTSHEPYGFQEFLRENEATSRTAPLYNLPNLYDYVTSSLGMATFSGTDSRRWALIDHGLQRIPASAPHLSTSIVKSIGLLAQYGAQVGLPASRELLRQVFADSNNFDAALDILEQESIVIYRRHSNSYGLWEGSDLDLDEVFSEAKGRLAREPLHERLSRVLDLQPAVARAHYIKTGTLRFFESTITSADARSVSGAIEKPTQADGRIVFVLDTRTDSTDRGRELSRSITTNIAVLVAVPRLGAELVGALDEFECWQWVEDNATELEGDPVARQEVKARLDAARSSFEHTAGATFGLAGHPIDPTVSDWFFRGRSYRPTNSRVFQGLLTDICGKVYDNAPVILNELLNRHNLSSAAARARRNLLERMVQDQDLENIGIQGFPPEFSMYRAMLDAGGFHTKVKKEFGLRAPSRADWGPVWAEIDRFLQKSKAGKLPLSDLISRLKQPPFGLRDGPMPVLIATVLLAKGHELALYEDGLFVPELTIETLERLTRRPETFDVQSYELSSTEAAVLRALSKLIKAGKDDDVLLMVVKALVRLAASLPAYTKQTRRLGSPTIEVRDALMNATDPKALVFEELPDALGVDLRGKQAGERFRTSLTRCTKNLSNAYRELLDEIENAICSAFGIAARGAKARSTLNKRARPLVRYATDPRLQVFVREAARDDERDWREVLGRAVNDGKPPDYWNDEDVVGIRVKLLTLATEFDRLEELVGASEEHPGSTVVSIGVLDGEAGERRAIISCPAELAKNVENIARDVRSALQQSKDQDKRAKLLAIASIARELYNEVAAEED